MKLKYAGRGAGLILVLIAIVFIYNAVAIYHFSQQDQTQKADCAIVAGAGVEGERPSPVFQARLDHAIHLWQEGLVRINILTGGLSAHAQHADAAIARQYLLEQGIPASAILTEETSTKTRDNVQNAKALMQAHQLTTALMVSDPLHMYRLMLIAWDNDIQAWSSPAPGSLYRSWSTRLSMLTRESLWYTGYRIYRLMPQTAVQKVST
ncbi:multidrug MFS transporter [Superficieibacter electus]|uniref:Multidrug MFS transporter n=1 Tax=Superficieibacter electus TaxID=2022662 RepID=A0A2P5GJ43_9ENTR|nr:YdcF family protein [Superficieibacter electus]POP41275.1 multidrug MFS transporter [Superficieibacter electus]POP43524.1 multidrug MFS transporter [Superficieibacter electus]